MWIPTGGTQPAYTRIGSLQRLLVNAVDHENFAQRLVHGPHAHPDEREDATRTDGQFDGFARQRLGRGLAERLLRQVGDWNV